ncbi:MAG: hypothetical protein JNL18_23590 [Planctomycetaceae bacterium]|nr:hypothetical protein [Planctomycetaceae bacterium]
MTSKRSENDPQAAVSQGRFNFSLKLLLLVTTVVAVIAAFAAQFPVLAAITATVFIFVVILRVSMRSVDRVVERGADLMGVGPYRKVSLLVFSSVSGALCVVGATYGFGLVVFAGLFGALFSVMIWLAGRDDEIS